MSAKRWMLLYVSIQGISLILISFFVVIVDPFFHYHKPLKGLYYNLEYDNERSQNNGIERYFDYNGIITGTSMTQCFKTSEAEELFGGKFIKVPFAGGTYKEIDSNINTALEHNANINMVIRGIDLEILFWDKDRMREDMGVYPLYLYDSNIFNDTKYVFNKDVLKICVKMCIAKMLGKEGGITSFDEYSNWNKYYTYGADIVLSDRNIESYAPPETINTLSDDDMLCIEQTISQNVTSTAEKYPHVQFYYFFPPYSIAAYGDLYHSGELERYILGEKYAIELILKYPNIHLYSFSCNTDITCDLNNYRELRHYGEWINSRILNDMKNQRGLLTEDNYLKYIKDELKIYSEFDYEILFE